MPTLQIREIPQELFDQLKEAAENSRRSMTQEAIYIIEQNLLERQAIQKHLKEKTALASKVKKLKKHFEGISSDDIVKMIRQDRDR
jgi:ribosomal protein L9